jgi:hypothetical protein
LDLAQVENGVMKQFVNRLIESELAPATISSVTTCLKSLISSAVDENGNEMYPRKWNAEFIDAPPIVRASQKAPIISPTSLATAIRNAQGVYPFLFALLAGTGLRIGEALGLTYGPGQFSTWDPESMTIFVKGQMWEKNWQSTKSEAGIREVDVYPRLNAYLVRHVPVAPGALLFQTQNHGPANMNTLLANAHRMKVDGFHSLRRFRISHLESFGAPNAFVKYWAGHSGGNDITARYTKMEKFVEERKSFCLRAGLGFRLPEEEINVTGNSRIEEVVVNGIQDQAPLQQEGCEIAVQENA